jgi:hypothetical protein
MDTLPASLVGASVSPLSALAALGCGVQDQTVTCPLSQTDSNTAEDSSRSPPLDGLITCHGAALRTPQEYRRIHVRLERSLNARPWWTLGKRR